MQSRTNEKGFRPDVAGAFFIICLTGSGYLVILATQPPPGAILMFTLRSAGTRTIS